MKPRSFNLLSPAAEAFAEYLARQDSGEELDFELFCAERPKLTPKLRRLHQHLKGLSLAIEGSIEGEGDPGAHDAAPDSRASARGRQLLERLVLPDDGRYEILGEVARGGMGAILEVWDRNLRRNLAMKVLLQSRGGSAPHFEPRALARFLDEAQVTGQLEHPGIAPVHELGLDADGRVYFTMPLVRGQSLVDIIGKVHRDAEGWTVARALDVIVRVCEAVAYAHSKGVIHRDLKPSNVMVGAFGETYVMDWGLARVVGQEDPQGSAENVRSLRREVADDTSDPSLVTRDGDVVGTPAYMAPEQARGELAGLGPASDVYSIGAMLYHLLSGCKPYGESPDSDEPDAVLKAVRTRAPRSPLEFEPSIPLELAAICTKAMTRDVDTRYADAPALAEDLRAFMDKRVVGAYRTGPLTELSKWVQRNRGLALVSAGAVLALTVGFLVSTSLFFVADGERERADLAKERLRVKLVEREIEQGRAFARTGVVQQAEELLWSAFLTDPDSRHAYWALWEFHLHHPSLASFVAHRGAARACAVSPDETLIATGGDDALVQLWALPALDRTATLRGHASEVRSISFHPDGRSLASGSNDGTILVWDLAARRAARELTATGGKVLALCHDAAGTRLVSAHLDGSVHVWDPAAGVLLTSLHGGSAPIVDVQFAPDSSLLATAGDAGIQLWNRLEGQPSETLEGHSQRVTALAFSADGRTLVTGSKDRDIRLWDRASGKCRVLPSPNETITALLEAPDGRDVFAGGWYSIDRWDPDSLKLVESYRVPSKVLGIAIGARQRVLVAVLDSGELRVWDADRDPGRTRLPVHAGVAQVTPAPEGGGAVTGDEDGRVRSWDLETGRKVAVLAEHVEAVRAMRFSPNGRLLALGGLEVLRLIDVSTGDTVHAFGNFLGEAPGAVDFSPDSRTVAFATRQGTFELRDCASGEQSAVLAAAARTLAIRYSPDGAFLFTTARGRNAATWTAQGELLGRWETSATAWDAAVSSDGRRLATCGFRREIEIWNTERTELEAELAGHTANVFSVAFSPDDPTLLASCASDGTVRLWDIANERCLLVLETFDEGGRRVAFADDGRRLVATGRFGEVHAWDLTYFDRHIAGNVPRRLESLDAELAGRVDRAHLEAWVAAVPDGF